MKRRVWIVGPIAWDTVIYIDEYPEAGGFAQCKERIDRPGGTAGNVAIALATTGVETGFVTYLGNDEYGAKLLEMLKRSHIRNLEIKSIEGPTSHVLVAIDKTGDRTIFGLNQSHLSEVNLLGVELRAGDIVCFVLWRPYFQESLRYAQEKGCITVVGAEALDDQELLSADHVIGSQSDGLDEKYLEKNLERFKSIVLTRGAEGSILVTNSSVTTQDAFPADVVDTTGAGDSFLAGYLAAMAYGITEPKKILEIGSRWAALTVSLPTSIPPEWSKVPNSEKLLPNDR